MTKISEESVNLGNLIVVINLEFPKNISGKYN